MSRLASLFLSEPKESAGETPPAPPERYRLLFVDDEPNVLKALGRIFRKENYEILTALGAEEALAHFQGGGMVHLIISDQRMPGMQGSELLREVKKLSPDTIRIMLTGHADVTAVMGAINEGAVYKFITKPWNDDDLRITVALALEQFQLIQENRKLRHEKKEVDERIEKLSKFLRPAKSQLGLILFKKGLLTKEALDKALAVATSQKKPLPTVLTELKLCTEKQIREALAQDLKVQSVSLKEWQIPSELFSLLPRDFCEKASVIPLRREGRKVTVGMVDPTDRFLLDDLSFVIGYEIAPVLVDARDLAEKLGQAPMMGVEEMSLEDSLYEYDPLETIEVVIEEEEEEDLESLLRSKDLPPAIRVVNSVISEAVRMGASDVHIEPRTKHVSVRFRVDGLLTEKIHIPLNYHLPLVSRLKVMAELDIAERRCPQDGRITAKTAMKIIDLRVSTLPTVRGEKVVLRLLDRNASIKRLTSLGVTEEQAVEMRRMSSLPQGIVLSTGPTGSGKTTTLYGLLAESFDKTKNYVTIEDPVEYYLEYAGQVYVRERVGLSFASVLRSVMRQDPDVIMLGEIRDLETAQIAFHAALTGHMVFSSLHTNSAVETILRLRDMGMDPTVTVTALQGVISQRLVRRICPSCQESAAPDPEVLAQLGVTEEWKGKAARSRGCDACGGQGFKGRLALVEIFRMTDFLRDLLRADRPVHEVRRALASAGHKSLLEDGLDKARRGWTTLEEVLRVLGPATETLGACPCCGEQILPEYSFCPACAREVDTRCSNCGATIKEEWKFCAQCGEPRGRPKEACKLAT